MCCSPGGPDRRACTRYYGISSRGNLSPLDLAPSQGTGPHRRIMGYLPQSCTAMRTQPCGYGIPSRGKIAFACFSAVSPGYRPFGPVPRYHGISSKETTFIGLQRRDPEVQFLAPDKVMADHCDFGVRNPSLCPKGHLHLIQCVPSRSRRSSCTESIGAACSLRCRPVSGAGVPRLI